MKKIYPVIFALLCLVCAKAQITVNKTAIDFGTIDFNHLPDTARVQLTNKGAQRGTFHISLTGHTYWQIAVSQPTYFDWGIYCTVTLAPGESTEIKIFPNPQRDCIIQNLPVTQLRIRGDKDSSLIVIPFKYYFRTFLQWQGLQKDSLPCNQGDTAFFRFLLRNTSGRQLTLQLNEPYGSRYLTGIQYPQKLAADSSGYITACIVTNANTMRHTSTEITLIATAGGLREKYILPLSLSLQNIKQYAQIAFNDSVIYREIDYNGNGLFTFSFTNTGNLPLVISSCRSSCGCLVPTAPMEPILPGKSNIITAVYDTRRVGVFTKTLTVYSNDMYRPCKTLYVKGMVFPEKKATDNNGEKD